MSTTATCRTLAGYEVCDEGAGRWSVVSPAGAEYTVTAAGCSCDGFRFRRTCRHHKALVGTPAVPERRPRADGELALTALRGAIEADGLLEVVPAGSFARGRSTIKDLDLVVVATGDLAEASDELIARLPAEFSATVKRPGRIVRGSWRGLKCDLYLCSPFERGAMTLFLTGPMEFNMATRQRAIALGLLLNQYGLWHRVTDELVCGGDDRDILAALGMRYATPLEREAWRRS